MKNYKTLLLILIFISISSSISNYFVWESNVLQTGLITDFNSGSFAAENYMKLKAKQFFYPNIGITALPIYAMLAKYHIANEKYTEALELLNEKNDKNPYIGIVESLKANIYSTLNVRDSAYYYSKKAFEKLPVNALHFEQYIRELVIKKDLKTIKKVFRELNEESEVRDFQLWRTYFMAVIRLKEKEDEEINYFAQQAIEKFYSRQTLFLVASYILYGEENVTNSYFHSNKGEEYFLAGDFDESAEQYKKAFELFPLESNFAENAGMALIKAEKFKEAIVYFDKALGLIRENNGKSEFGIASSYLELGNKEKACTFFEKAMSYNFKPAFSFYSKNCAI